MRPALFCVERSIIPNVLARWRVLVHAAHNAVAFIERGFLVRGRGHRQPGTARGFPAVAQGDHLVGVFAPRCHIGIGVGRRAEVLGEGSVAAHDGIGHGRGRTPVCRRHCRPAQVYLAHRRRVGGQGRAGAELIAELLPGRRTLAIEVHLERRILARGAEMPGIVIRAVAVQVHVPVRIDAAVAGGRLQGRGRLPGAPGTTRLARGARVPVAGRDCQIVGVLSDQAPNSTSIAYHAPRGVAGLDRAASEGPDQAPNGTSIAYHAYHAPRGIAGLDAALTICRHATAQPPDPTRSRYAPRGIAGGYVAGDLADEPAGRVSTNDPDRGVAGLNLAPVYANQTPDRSFSFHPPGCRARCNATHVHPD